MYLPISPVVTVNVSTAAVAPFSGYNTGLILGKSTHISSTDRCKTVGSLAELAALGFVSTDPEYIAADLYFKQTPRPRSLVVGVNVGTGSGTITYEDWDDVIDEVRAVNDDWYGVYVADASITAADHAAIATKVETLNAVYFFDDSAAADVTSATTDIFSTLKTANRKRSCGLYSGTAYAGAALMGRAMGLNTGEPNSAFTLAYKTLAGVTADDLSAAEVGYLEDKNGNCYINRGGYPIVEKGVTTDGTWFDEVIGLDQLVKEIQANCMEVLVNNPKIPYTDAGALQFVVACNEACQTALNRGFLIGGVWHGAQVYDLNTGDTLEEGYLCQAQPVDEISDANRQARIAPDIYVCAILSGAMQSVTIRVYIQ